MDEKSGPLFQLSSGDLIALCITTAVYMVLIDCAIVLAFTRGAIPVALTANLIGGVLAMSFMRRIGAGGWGRAFISGVVGMYLALATLSIFP